MLPSPKKSPASCRPLALDFGRSKVPVVWLDLIWHDSTTHLHLANMFVSFDRTLKFASSIWMRKKNIGKSEPQNQSDYFPRNSFRKHYPSKKKIHYYPYSSEKKNSAASGWFGPGWFPTGSVGFSPKVLRGNFLHLGQIRPSNVWKVVVLLESNFWAINGTDQVVEKPIGLEDPKKFRKKWKYEQIPNQLLLYDQVDVCRCLPLHCLVLAA